MTVKLLTEHHLEILSLKGDSTGSYESTLYTGQNATLLKMACRGSYLTFCILMDFPIQINTIRMGLSIL